MAFLPPAKLTRDDLIQVLRDNFAEHWVEGLLEDPDSSAYFEGTIDMLLRIQDAIDENLFNNLFIQTSSGRAPATDTLRLFRAGGGPAGEIPVNTDIRDSRGGRWRPTAAFSVPFSAVDQTVDVPLTSVRSGYWLNSFQPLTFLLWDDLFDANLTVVAGTAPASGGKTPFLDLHGKERGVHRVTGEADPLYRLRLLLIEEMVSPVALASVIVDVLSAFPESQPIADLITEYGFRALVEPFKDSAQFSQPGLAGDDAAFFDDITYLDDPGAPKIKELADACAFFEVYLPTIASPAEVYLFADDGYLDDPLLGYPDIPYPFIVAAIYQALFDELNRRRAGGVKFRIWVGEDLRLVRQPPTGTLVDAGDWVDQDGSAGDANLTSALASHDGDTSFAVSTVGTGSGTPTVAGDLLFDYPAVPTFISGTGVTLRAWVRKEDVGAGVDPSVSFLIKPTSSGSFVRVGSPQVVDTDRFFEVSLHLPENPVTALPWVNADLDGVFGVGLANTAAVGATEELRVSELTCELVLNYG